MRALTVLRDVLIAIALVFLIKPSADAATETAFYETSRRDLNVTTIENISTTNVLECARKCAHQSNCWIKAYEIETKSCLIGTGVFGVINNTQSALASNSSLMGNGTVERRVLDSGNWTVYLRHDIPATCEAGWSYFGDSCYLVSPVFRVFDDSDAYCAIKGAHLATPTSLEESDFVTELINNTLRLTYTEAVLGSLFIWIGANDITTEGTFEWITGESWNFSNFNSGEPNGNIYENCVAFFPVSLHHFAYGKWNDNGCSNSFPYVCEKEA